MADAILADVCSSGIYQIRNLVNGKRYIGSAVRFRSRWHKHISALRRGVHHNAHLQNAWQKYGEDSFEFSIVEVCPRDKLLEREQFHIDQGCDYNKCMTAGSPLGVKHSLISKARMGAASRASWRKRKEEAGGKVTFTEEHRSKISKSRREMFANGYKKPADSQETSLRRSASSKAKWEDPEYRLKVSSGIAASYTQELLLVRSKHGKKMWETPGYRQKLTGAIRSSYTEELRAERSRKSREMWSDPEFKVMMASKMADCRTPVSEETKQKLRQANLGKKHSVDTRKKKSCLSDSQVVKIRDALNSGASKESIAREFGVSSTTVKRISYGERYQWVA